jgi:hypothetical protein
MKKRDFYSTLFGRKIFSNENDFDSIAIAEVLYRINELEEKHCNCLQCQTDLGKFRKSLLIMKKELLNKRSKEDSK